MKMKENEVMSSSKTELTATDPESFIVGLQEEIEADWVLKEIRVIPDDGFNTYVARLERVVVKEAL